MGCKTLYTTKLANRIITELRGGRQLFDICRDEGMPGHVTVMDWVRQNRAGFAPRYHRARHIAGSGAGGRPSLYTPELAHDILEELSAGRTLLEVCRIPGMPALRTVQRWVTTDRGGFKARYERARETGYQAMADQIIDIADDSGNDWIVRQAKDGSSVTVPNPQNINRARLRCNERRWLLSKMLPERFGTRPEPAPNDVDFSLVLKAVDGSTRGLPKDHRAPWPLNQSSAGGSS